MQIDVNRNEHSDILVTIDKIKIKLNKEQADRLATMISFELLDMDTEWIGLQGAKL